VSRPIPASRCNADGGIDAVAGVRHLSALGRLFLLASLLVFGLAAVPTAASAVAAPKSGPLLVEGGVFQVSGGTRPLTFRSWCDPAVFSPDGSALASGRWTSANECDDSTLVIRRADGPTTQLAALPGDVLSISWSPDGLRLAAYVANNQGDQIWTLGVDGSAATKVYDGSTDPVKLDSTSVSWSPDGSRLAFSGTDKVHLAQADLRRSTRSFVGQVYTIPAAGGTPQAYSVPAVDPSCAAARACHAVRYGGPRWSPDGSALLVDATDITWQADGGIQVSTAVATLTEGATEPTRLKALDAVAYRPEQSPNIGTPAHFHQWAADGASVVTWYRGAGARSRPGADRYARVTLATKAAKRVGPTRSSLLDWQPCPAGTCVVWPASATPKLTVTSVARTPAGTNPFTVAGTVTPRQLGLVQLWLDVRRGGAWKPYSTSYARLTDRHHFRGPLFERPKSGSCRIVAQYLLITAVKKVRC
jgi:dipeptidyl aminopeptidase/acylaminoacyl peptidase